MLPQTIVISWYCLDQVVLEGMSQVSRRSEVAYINGAPSTPGYLLALLRELSHVPRGLPEIAEAKQVRKTNQTGILYKLKKKGSESRSSRFEFNISLISCVCVLLCFVDPILGNLTVRGHSLSQGTWGCRILTLHLNYVAGYTGPLLFLFERTHNYSVDNQGLLPWRLRRLVRSKVRSDSSVRCVPGSNRQTRGKPDL